MKLEYCQTCANHHFNNFSCSEKRGEMPGGVACPCLDWASTDVVKAAMLKHHENCPHREPIELISKLISGIEVWARDEDGVHYALWDAYRAAKLFLTGEMPEGE